MSGGGAGKGRGSKEFGAFSGRMRTSSSNHVLDRPLSKIKPGLKRRWGGTADGLGEKIRRVT